jgi:hypothetical protein
VLSLISALMMETKSFSEMLTKLTRLTQLSVRGEFIEFGRSESVQICTNLTSAALHV